MTLRNGKAQVKKFKSFWNKHLNFLLKYSGENGKEKFFSNDITSNLKNAKTNTIMII